LLLVLLLCCAPLAAARKFYNDDPIRKEPPPRDASGVVSRKLSDYYDLLNHMFATPGELNGTTRSIRAGNVNTSGEVPDSGWYTNRHYTVPMSIEELARGVGHLNVPHAEGQWTVIAAKSEGVTPGFTIRDARGRRYVMKFDPGDHPEMTTAAEIISSKFFHALGYFVPENYLVEFAREQLVLGQDVQLRDQLGNLRRMTERDITEILLNVPRNASGRYRAVASLYIAGRNVGPFRYYGTRSDDPNDVVPHEHRRELRGLSIFCAWLGHDDSRAINTSDFLVQEGEIQYIKHYLIDFGSTLGSGSTRPNSPRSGFEYLFSWGPSFLQLFTLGLAVPEWAKAEYPDVPAVGRFESEKFAAEGWVPEYPNPAFLNRLPDDEFWAARQVMNFSDDEIRAIVRTGGYSDPAAEQWVTDRLIERRDRIGHAFLTRVLPLDRFNITSGTLVFEDLAAEHGVSAPTQYSVQWFRFDNASEASTVLRDEAGFSLPEQVVEAPAGEYFLAELHGADPAKTIRVFVRTAAGGAEIVGIERTW
jgi:hypothetical protein